MVSTPVYAAVSMRIDLGTFAHVLNHTQEEFVLEAEDRPRGRASDEG